jgi:hypothetical protein
VTAPIGERDARYAHDLVERICREVGPGLPASPEERRRAAILAHELEAHLGPGGTTVEEFTVAPGAFTASVPIAALLTLAAAILVAVTGRIGVAPWITAAGALACAAAALLILLLEFVYSFEVIDRLFRARPSVNVVGTLRHPDTRAVRRLLLVSGHHDSAPENTWLRALGFAGLIVQLLIPLGVVTMLALALVQLAGGGAPGTVGWILLAFPVAPAVVVGLFFTRGRRGGGTVPGAVDNLAASAITVALCRFLVEHPDDIPRDTEIRFVSFGSEEAGTRGSRRYVARHRDELARLDARLLNLEMVADPVITIFTSDLNRSVRHAPEMVRSAVAAAEAAGVPYRVAPAGPGVGTDAGSFSRAGLKAVTLFPFRAPEQLVAFYHQRRDTPDVLTLPPIENALRLALAWIRRGGEAPPVNA